MRTMTVAPLFAALLATAAGAAEVSLVAVQFPEQREVTVGFAATDQAPRARLEAAMTFSGGQGRIEVAFDDMKPAILFGGDVTSYLVWAVGREGKTVNLGELPVRERRGSALLSTGLKEFALLITAEIHPLVDVPSAVNITEGAAYGAALLAGVGGGLYQSVEEAVTATVKVTDRTAPVAEAVRRYEELYPVYRNLYLRTAGHV